jgi:hypothetical protein
MYDTVQYCGRRTKYGVKTKTYILCEKGEIIHRGRITSNKKGGTTIMGKMWVPVEDDGGENSWLGGAVGLTMQERDEELGL